MHSKAMLYVLQDTTSYNTHYCGFGYSRYTVRGAVPRDVEILPAPEQSEKPARPEHDDALHRALRHLHVQIAHAAQPAPVAQVDDLLAPQVRKSFHHAVPPRNQPMLHRAGPMSAFPPDTGYLSSPPAAAPGRRHSPAGRSPPASGRAPAPAAARIGRHGISAAPPWRSTAGRTPHRRRHRPAPPGAGAPIHAGAQAVPALHPALPGSPPRRRPPAHGCG